MNPQPSKTGNVLLGYRGAYAQQQKYPGREWTIPGINAMARYWAMIRRLLQWAQSEHPDIVAQCYAHADIELARRDAEKAHNDAMKAKKGKKNALTAP